MTGSAPVETIVPDLVCPIHKTDLVGIEDGFGCSHCDGFYEKIEIDGSHILDFRARDRESSTRIDFRLPTEAISEQDGWKEYGKASEADFKTFSREQFRKRFNTKLQKEIAFYSDFLLKERGPESRILDLGCGDASTRIFLQTLGFRNIVCVDWMHRNADFLVDVHRMPFRSNYFDMIVSTACLEHFYNPFVAFHEVARVLNSEGMLIASGSFWESWHGRSCFHFTPGGLEILCRSSGLGVEDMWSAWGFIPSVSSHALGLSRFKRFTYFVQSCFDWSLKVVFGKDFARKHKFRTSGSFGLFARKL